MALIRVRTEKLSRSIPCRAFYDNMENALSVGIKLRGKFHSYIEAKYFSFDLTRNGKLLQVDVWKPKSEWIVEENLVPPEKPAKENIVFLDFRLKTDPASYYTNPQRSILHIRFASGQIARFVSPANSLIFELSTADELVGLWITNIEDDYGFRKETAWRLKVKSLQAE